MVTNTNIIWRYYMLKNLTFWDNNFQKMGQLMTFCKNIMVTNTDNICRYNSLKNLTFWDNNFQKWDNLRRFVKI